MHTATRLALPVIDRVRALESGRAHLRLRSLRAAERRSSARARRRHDPRRRIRGRSGRIWQAVSWLVRPQASTLGLRPIAPPTVDLTRPCRPSRVSFPRIDRGLPRLDEYAVARMARRHEPHRSATPRRAAAASTCAGIVRSCRSTTAGSASSPVDVVLADIRAQVEQGARHITFGDPDFFNGIGHARRIVERTGRASSRHSATTSRSRSSTCCAMRQICRSLARHRLRVRHVRRRVGRRCRARALEKGHTRADFERAVAADARGLGWRWCRRSSRSRHGRRCRRYLDLLETIDALDLVEHVAPVQLAIRLLIPAGSRLLELPDIRALVGPFDPRTLAYPWHASRSARRRAAAARVDALVGVSLTAPRRSVFARVVRTGARRRRAGRRRGPRLDMSARAAVPYLNEPWYC